MEFLAQYGMFALKTFTLVIAILILVAGMVCLSHKPKHKVAIKSLNKSRDAAKTRMRKEVLGLKKDRSTKKKSKKDKEQTPSIFVIEFTGDKKASQVEQLRDEISLILLIATPKRKNKGSIIATL